VSNKIENQKMNEEIVRELVGRFKHGDEKAYNELANLFKQRIFNLVLKMVRNREDAMDLAQEAFVKAYHSLKDFREEASFSTWLYRIAVNLCLNFTQRDKFRSFILLEEVSQPVLSSESPLKDLEQKELNQAIDQAVLNLPSKQRAVFILRHYQELPHSEIAKILDKSEGTIKANYFQAVKKLRKSLAGFME
jgi:RNA polymerase sigma-70 factor (ECF subfamily)